MSIADDTNRAMALTSDIGNLVNEFVQSTFPISAKVGGDPAWCMCQIQRIFCHDGKNLRNAANVALFGLLSPLMYSWQTLESEKILTMAVRLTTSGDLLSAARSSIDAAWIPSMIARASHMLLNLG